MKINILDNSSLLNYSVHYQRSGEKTVRSIHLKLKHTRHSFKRASQRGLDAHKLATTLEFGELYFRQGLVFYVLGENNIPDNLKKESSKLQNTVVVVSGDDNQVITCYRSKNPFKHIKTKRKQLKPPTESICVGNRIIYSMECQNRINQFQANAPQMPIQFEDDFLFDPKTAIRMRKKELMAA